MASFLHDIAYAIRTLRRAPGLVTTAVLSLALGIAANTAVFSFVNAVQFKALPFADERTLVDVEETSATELCSGCAVGTSYPTLLDWQSRAASFSAVEAFQELRMIVSGDGEPERVPAAYVSATLFPMLGLRPALGRALTAEDERVGADPVVLLSDPLWRRRYGSDPHILGRAIKVNGVPHVVVGVMPAGVRFPEFAQFWTPLAPAAHAARRGDRSLSVIARLKTGTDTSQADTEMRTIAAALAAAHPDTNARWTASVRPLRAAMTAETVAPSIVLMSAVLFVLLIASANVSNLLIVRASERQREIAIRMAIGSSRWRIFRLLLAESAVLSAGGGLLGLGLALWASRLIVASLGVDAPYWIRFGIDWHVFTFCAAVTIGTTLVFGTAPALHGARHDPQTTLKEGGTTTAARGRRLAGSLVIAQLALALVLLAAAGLLIKAVSRTFRFDPGYDAAHVLEGDLSLSDRRYDAPGAITTFVAAVFEHLTRIPNVKPGVSRMIFFGGFGAQSRQVTVEGLSTLPDGASPSFYFAVTPGYFRMLGMPVHAGREFAPGDLDAAVVNLAMAQRVWPGINPLGRRIRFGSGPWLTVIGVVGNEGAGMMSARVASFAYVPFALEPGRDFALMISAPGTVAALAPEVRAAVKAADPDQPLEDVMTMAAAFREQAAPARFVGLLMSSLSALALLLAAIGLYGVTAHGLRRRVREIGIRLALGGTPRDIVRLVQTTAWTLIGPGLALGLFGAWAGTRLLEGILFGISPTDPLVLGSVALVLAAVAALASYIPARIASSVDPVVVLRAE